MLHSGCPHGAERLRQLLRVAHREVMQLHLRRGSGGLECLLHGRHRIGWESGRAEERDPSHPRQHSPEELQAFRRLLGNKGARAGGVPAGTRQALGHAAHYRIAAIGQDDGHRGRHAHGGKRADAVVRKDGIDLERDELGRDGAHPLVAALGPAVFDDEVLALHVAQLAQAVAYPFDFAHVARRRCRAEKSDPVHLLRLLRGGRGRPAGRHHARQDKHSTPTIHRANSAPEGGSLTMRRP